MKHLAAAALIAGGMLATSVSTADAGTLGWGIVWTVVPAVLF